MARHAVQEVDYGTFMTMTENKEIGQVEVEDNQIIFTNKNGSKVYKTGPMNDPDLTQRLYDAGAEFTRDIVEETSPLLSFVLTWILPIIIFIAIGQLMTKKLTDRAGGPGSHDVRAQENPTPRSMCSPPRASTSPTWPARMRPRRTCRRS